MVELSYKCASWLVINENRKIPCQIGRTFFRICCTNSCAIERSLSGISVVGGNMLSAKRRTLDFAVFDSIKNPHTNRIAISVRQITS
jgi:hypothetical protein